MPSLTVENYCKAIFQCGSQYDVQWVGTGRLAEALGVSPGTVTSMLKTLAESGLAEYRPYEGVRLAKSGEALALRMLRRHRLIELFLVRTLGLNWDEVHEEAEHMEHAVSDVLVDRIDDFLGHPDCDPHGDPIPRSDGTMRGEFGDAQRLSACEAGDHVQITRVLKQAPEFLRFLTEAGLELGSEATVTQNIPDADIVTLHVAGHDVSLGNAAAEQLLVQKLAGVS